MTAPIRFEMQLRVPSGGFTLDFACRSSQRILGIFGPSGSGKTTLLEAIAGLKRASSGYLRCDDSVWLDNRQGIRVPASARHIGYVPQDHLLFPHWSVRQNLLAGQHRASSPSTHPSDFDEIVQVLGLDDLLNRRIEGLSGGERQRVALGRALCSHPRLLMLDEPLAALDLPRRKRILPLLRKVCAQFDLPILLVSHSAFEIQALCDEVVVLEKGRATDQGPPNEVFTQTTRYGTVSENGYENVFGATVKQHEPHTTFVALGDSTSGPEVRIPKLDLSPGRRLSISLPAKEIILATQAPVGLSARNCLPGTIHAISQMDDFLLVKVALAGTETPSLTVELTEAARSDLNLQQGSPVHVIFKTSSVTTYA